MTKITLGQYLFGKKTNAKVVVINSQKTVIPIADGRLYIGRTPGRFIEILGHQGGEELSIQNVLDNLRANEAARRIFPLAVTPGSYWIYFALFSKCTKNPGVNKLKSYINFLKEKLKKNNAGVARILLNDRHLSKRKLRKLAKTIEKYRAVHDIRERIEDGEEVIQDDILYRLNNLILSGKNASKNFKQLAREFRKAWCRQSEILRENNYSVLIKAENPRGIHNEDLLRVYVGYWLIRGLFGIEVQPNNEEDEKESHKVGRLNSKKVKRAANMAIYYLNRLFNTDNNLKNSTLDIMKMLREAEKTGKAQLFCEYMRRQAEGSKILNSFRLTRFWTILEQLDNDVQKGFRR